MPHAALVCCACCTEGTPGCYNLISLTSLTLFPCVCMHWSFTRPVHRSCVQTLCYVLVLLCCTLVMAGFQLQPHCAQCVARNITRYNGLCRAVLHTSTQRHQWCVPMVVLVGPLRHIAWLPQLAELRHLSHDSQGHTSCPMIHSTVLLYSGVLRWCASTAGLGLVTMAGTLWDLVEHSLPRCLHCRVYNATRADDWAVNHKVTTAALRFTPL